MYPAQKKYSTEKNQSMKSIERSRPKNIIKIYATKQQYSSSKLPNHEKKRKITLYNPQFIALIEKLFITGHELRQICNRYTLKISYSCMENIDNKIKAHNDKSLKIKNITKKKTHVTVKQKKNVHYQENALSKM